VIDLRFSLLADGSSDRALIPILSWLMRQHGVLGPIQARWADLRGLRLPPRTLTERIRLTVDLFPCDLLFVHRDAETEPHSVRRDEIHGAVASVSSGTEIPPAVCVIPVRMQEAWLLTSEEAVRIAAGNPNGRQRLTLPVLTDLENIPDPKELLYEFLREASGLAGRRRQRFRAALYAPRVSEFTRDFAPLRALSAFRELELEVARFIRDSKWA